MKWYYVDGPLRVGPLGDTEWSELVSSGKIRPETLIWHEGLDVWTPYSEVSLPPVPEAEEEPEPEPGEEEASKPGAVETPEAFAARVLEHDYEVRAFSCLRRARDLLKGHFWMLVGSTFFVGAVMLVALKIPSLSVLVGALLQGVFVGGLLKVYLRLIRSGSVEVGDLFAGFDPGVFWPLSLKTMVSFLMTILFFELPTSYASRITGVTVENLQATLASDPQAVSVFLLVVVAGFIPTIYFSVCWMFALPLIVDKRMGCWPALRLSRRKVLQHPWRVMGLTILAGIAGCLGGLLFGIGILFTMPLYFASVLYLYEDIFHPGNHEPPPPTAAKAE